MHIKKWIAALGTRIDAAIEATPDWVFAIGPRLLGSLLINGLLLGALLYGLHLTFGTSLNPFENFSNLIAGSWRR